MRINNTPAPMTSFMKSILALLASTILGGCNFVYSFEPLVPERAAVSDDRLLGSWEIRADDPDDVMWATVVADGHRSYTIELDSGNEGHPEEEWCRREFYLRGL